MSVSNWKCGHPRTPENTKVVRAGTGTACKECFKAHNRAYLKKKRAGARYDPAVLLLFAQRFERPLRRLKPKGAWSDGPAPWTISNALVSARKQGLCESKVVRDYPTECRWRITPLGTAVLDFASAMSAGTAETQSGSGLQPASAVPKGHAR